MLFLVILLAACNGTATPPPTGSPALPTETLASPDASPQPSSTPIPPTSTPVPLAALVDGAPITLAEFQAEVARYQSAPGTDPAADIQQIVLDELIDQTLLALSAAEQGFIVDEALLQARIDQLAGQLGGAQALNDWMAGYGYSEPDFRLALARAIAAAWMRDQIAAAVPEVAEQAHVRQILLYNSDQADQVYALLQSGQDFAQLASQYDSMTGGDLGWFPRGFLTEPSLEDAAFALEPGEYSPVIETRLGYHILQLIEIDPQHPLLPDARRALQAEALRDWLEQRRAQSEIMVLLP